MQSGGCPVPLSPPSPVHGEMSLSLSLAALLTEEETLNTKETFQCAAGFWLTG